MIVLGAGPAGLAAAHTLAQGGRAPVVVERADRPGGLMRGVKRGDFCVDLGRKELYPRIPEVTELWEALLGPDLVPYPHRVGVLYDGAVIERSPRFRGIRRGMPLRLLARCAADFVVERTFGLLSPPPRNLEEHWHRARGAYATRLLSQGYAEKLYGRPWSDQPLPERTSLDDEARGSLLDAARSMLRRARQDEPLPWRHPAEGTEQIVRALQRRIEAAGGQLALQTTVKALQHDGRRITGAVLERGGVQKQLPIDELVSALPVTALASLLGLETAALRQADERRRQTLILYVFVDEPPRFDHAWLEVSCPKLRSARITNYAAFGGRMVPEGQTCLAVEVFATEGDLFPRLDDANVMARLIAELTGAGLLDPSRIFDRVLLRLPGAEAAREYQAWQQEAFRDLTHQLRRFENLYEVNRAGTDVAMYAGLEAGRAVLTGDRRAFDERCDPARPYDLTRALPPPPQGSPARPPQRPPIAPPASAPA